MRVIGTAGHVDHGKSTLVQSLTGIDPDRLDEEKKRGMTIDLGFAWVDLPVPSPIEDAEGQNARSATASSIASETPTSLQSVGIVDVPGHIDFIKNMLAGVGGIDAALIVVAADEGVMPQTREHLDILDLLNVPSAVVALTKVDLIDEPDWLDLIELDVVELLQHTQFAESPILRVSAATGHGLGELKEALGATLARLEPRRNRARPRLPIDRVFTLSGFGTVVTGTLGDGFFKVGDNVEILPTGISARIRGLQSHKKPIWQGEPGSRLAINLSNISAHDIHRGDVIAKPDTLRGTVLIDVNFRLLPNVAKPLVHNQAVEFFSGATESPARVRLLGAEKLEPGETGWLQLRLERPCVLTAGDRYILRQPSPSVTLGGGSLLNPHPQRRWRRFDESVIARLHILAQGAPDEILLQTLSRSPLVEIDELLGLSGLDLELAREALNELESANAYVTLDLGSDSVLLTIETWQQLTEKMLDILDGYHRKYPLRRGIPRGELRSRLESILQSLYRSRSSLPVRIFNAYLKRAVQEGFIESDDTSVWKHGHEMTVTLHQQAMIDALMAEFERSPYAPPSQSDSLRQLDDNQELLEYLIEEGKLSRVGSNVLFRAQDLSDMERQIQSYIRENGSITLGQTRDLFQTSRKYVQAILEDMDARRITRRDGDLRVLR